jgi:hypothetical protein
MGEANRVVGPILTPDGRVRAGWIGIAMLVPDKAAMVVAFPADKVERVLAGAGRALKMTKAAQDNPRTHATLWLAVFDLAQAPDRVGGPHARERLGRMALWLVLNTPGGEPRQQFDGLQRAGLAPHITLTADRHGRWNCVIGPRFDGAAQAAARSMVVLDAAPGRGPLN